MYRALPKDLRVLIADTAAAKTSIDPLLPEKRVSSFAAVPIRNDDVLLAVKARPTERRLKYSEILCLTAILFNAAVQAALVFTMNNPLDKIIIIGARDCGVTAAFSLRDLVYTGQITLIRAEAELPYERPPFSKKLEFDKCIIADQR